MKYGIALMEQFWDQHASWSNETFGDETVRGPLGPLRHLEKEAREAQESPNDVTEYADCLMLIFDAARRAGFSFSDLADASYRKLAVNRARQWPEMPPDQAVEHVKGDPTP